MTMNQEARVRHAAPIVAAAQALARGNATDEDHQWRYRIAAVVEWAAILVSASRHGSEDGMRMARRALTDIIAGDDDA